MKWTTACVDWEQRIVERRSLIAFDPLFPDEAEYALGIFKQLRVPDLPGKPTFGECSEQWVFDLVKAVFGSYDSTEHRQLIREFFLLISKKNTKSTICAGIMVTALIIGEREEEEHLILAPTKEVADNAFKPAAGMVRADDELMAMFQIQDHIKTITHRVKRSSLKVVAADTDTVGGKKAGRIMVDELWLFGKKANADSMLMEATGGQISRDDGWVIYLTTQSDEPPAGVFKSKLNYFRDVRDGKEDDPRSLGVLYEFPQHMLDSKAYLKPENFYVTNPNIGRSVSAAWLEDNLRKEQPKQDGSFQKFIAKHLNIEIGQNLRSDRWAGADFWQCNSAGVTIDTLIERSDVIEIGIDGGGLDDMLGMAAIGRDAETGEWLHWAHAWIDPIVLDRRKQEASRFRDFERDGDLTIVHVGTDVLQVAGYVAQIEASGLLDRIGVDQAGIGAIVDAIVDNGIEQDRIVGIPQGWRLVGAIKTTERKLAEGAMKHGSSPMMAWCVSNAKVEPRGNAVVITKQTAGNAKIDPLMATFNAAALMAMNPQGRGKLDDFINHPVMA